MGREAWSGGTGRLAGVSSGGTGVSPVFGECTPAVTSLEARLAVTIATIEQLLSIFRIFPALHTLVNLRCFPIETSSDRLLGEMRGIDRPVERNLFRSERNEFRSTSIRVVRQAKS